MNLYIVGLILTYSLAISAERCNKTISKEILLQSCQSNFTKYEGSPIMITKYSSPAKSFVPVRVRKIREIELTCDMGLLFDTTVSHKYGKFLTSDTTCNNSYAYPLRKCRWLVARTTSGYEVEDEVLSATYDWISNTYDIPSVSPYWKNNMGNIDHRVVCLDLSPVYICSSPTTLECVLLNKIEKGEMVQELMCPTEGEIYRISEEISNHRCADQRIFVTESGSILGLENSDVKKFKLVRRHVKSEISPRLRMLTHIVEEEKSIIEDAQCQRIRKNSKQRNPSEFLEDCNDYGYTNYPCYVNSDSIIVNYDCSKGKPIRRLTNASFPDEQRMERNARFIKEMDNSSGGETRPFDWSGFVEKITTIRSFFKGCLIFFLISVLLSMISRIRAGFKTCGSWKKPNTKMELESDKSVKIELNPKAAEPSAPMYY